MSRNVIKFPSTYKPPGDEGLEARVARLESHVEHIDTTLTDIKQDIREIKKEMSSNLKWSIGVTITLFSLLAGMMAKGFHWF